MSAPTARECAVALARFEDADLQLVGGALPEFVTLLSLLGILEPTADGLRERWRASDAAATSLVTRFALSEDGPLDVDLVADGPHGLVAGTTGAGKSELLRSLVAALAVRALADAGQLRPHRLQGRQRVRRVRRAAPHRGDGHRPRRAARGARAAQPGGRAALPRAGAARAPRLGPDRVRPARRRRAGRRRCPGCWWSSTSSPRSPPSCRTSCRRWSASPSAAAASASTCCWPPSGPRGRSTRTSAPTPTSACACACRRPRTRST